MGSWYGTCGLTQLPLVDEQVVMIQLKLRNTGTAHGGDHVYPHDIWEPHGMPVYGQYYDYGEMRIPDHQTRVHAANIHLIANDLIERPYIDEYEPEITAESMLDIVKYQEAIHKGRLTLSQMNYASDTGEMIEAAVGRMFINRTVWDELVQNGPKPRWKGDTQVFDKAYYRDGIIKACDPNRTPEENALTLEILYNGNMGLRSAVFAIRRHASNLTGKIHDAFVAQFADQMAELYVIDNIMMQLRKTWMPQAGAGSQESDYHAYRVLLAGMQKTMKTRDDQRRADGWDDEEEE